MSAEDITSMIKNEVRKEKVALERKIKGLSEANRELKDRLSRIEDEIDARVQSKIDEVLTRNVNLMVEEKVTIVGQRLKEMQGFLEAKMDDLKVEYADGLSKLQVANEQEFNDLKNRVQQCQKISAVTVAEIKDAEEALQTALQGASETEATIIALRQRHDEDTEKFLTTFQRKSTDFERFAANKLNELKKVATEKDAEPQHAQLKLLTQAHEELRTSHETLQRGNKALVDKQEAMSSRVYGNRSKKSRMIQEP